EEESALTVDGNIEDWSGIKQTEQTEGNVESANIDIVKTGAYTDSIYLSLLTITDEPIFASTEGKTIRIFIDTDNSYETGFSLPGVGADYMVELYGKGQTSLSSVLYSFNDNKDTNDWNGFFALSSVDTRTRGVNTEIQIPLFDLGINGKSEMKLVWQTTDNEKMTDLADNVVSLTGEGFTLSSKIETMISDANSDNTGEGIVIDGYFGDWNNIEKQFDQITSAESEHISLEQYAAIEQNDDYFMYMNVEGNILNGISVPSYSAKSMPDLKTGSSSENEPVGVSNQESTPLPVITGEDTIYVLIDTDNDYTTGYSSLGTGIGAEKMVEIKGVHGIITLRVMKEWTGSNNNDWEWSQGELIDAAAYGGELELEVANGKYWIHIVGWNGEEESSSDFDLYSEDGRYVTSGSTCYFYYRFGGVTDTCGGTAAGDTLTDPDLWDGSAVSNDVSLTASGYIDQGQTFDGTDDFLKGSSSGLDITDDWSFEAWINTDTSNDGAIFFIGNADDSTANTNELSISLKSGDELQMCYSQHSTDECYNSYEVHTSGVNFNTNQWYHIAVVHNDGDGDIAMFVNGVAVVNNDGTNIA
ncbi:uncharacterized protein METZ01_LOCUS194987, partial [marine metagenome]